MRRARACASPGRSRNRKTPRVAAALIIDAPRRADAGLRGEPLIVRGGPRSLLARKLGTRSIWGKRLDSQDLSRGRRRAARGGCASISLVRQVATPLRRRRLAPCGERGSPRRGRRARRRQAGKSVFRGSLPHPRRRAGERRRRLVRARRPRAHGAGRSGPTRVARMALPLGRRGPRKAQGKRKEELRHAGEPNVFLPALVLLADHGARRRHLGAQRRLPAQHAADAGQLRAALRARRALRSGGAGRDLLRGPEPARPVLLPRSRGRW